MEACHFEPTELLARCRAMMRRRDQRVEEPVFVNGKQGIDFTALRRKLGEAAQIKTETGIGYRMESA